MNCLPTFKLKSYTVIIIFVFIKPFHPKIAHACAYRLVLKWLCKPAVLTSVRWYSHCNETGIIK